MAAVLISGCVNLHTTAPETPIGTAKMLADGSLSMQLRAEYKDAIGDALFLVKPNDPRYGEYLAHLGGLTPGEEKPVPPWPTK